MSDLNIGGLSGMEINSALIAAARAVVKGGAVVDTPVEIPDYPEMYVATSGDEAIQVFHYFAEGDERYAIGAMKN